MVFTVVVETARPKSVVEKLLVHTLICNVEISYIKEYGDLGSVAGVALGPR